MDSSDIKSTRFDKGQRKLKDLAKTVELLKVESEKFKISHVIKPESSKVTVPASVKPPTDAKENSTSGKAIGKGSQKMTLFRDLVKRPEITSNSTTYDLGKLASEIA
jgi:hypothetical protein